MSIITNRVSKSSLVTIDIKKIIVPEKIVGVDVFLLNNSEQMVSEKTIKKRVSEYDFSSYFGKYVFVFHSQEMILPLWVPMLVAKKLYEHSLEMFFGSREEAFPLFAQKMVEKYDFSFAEGKPVVIPGCADIPNMETILMFLVKHLTPKVKKISFGEACSAVPI